MQEQRHRTLSQLQRIRIWYGLLLGLAVILLLRLFYLQVIKFDYYKKAAMASQLKEYEIPADRGTIEAYNGDKTVPLVLNQTLYTLFADPKYIKDSGAVAKDIQKIIGGKVSDYQKAMNTPLRYVVLANKLNKVQKEQLDTLKIKGIGTRGVPYRAYPQGSLAAQVLGFVDNDGKGQYGIEQALNGVLKGTPGQLRAITDAAGVPLATNKQNEIKPAKKGQDIVLTLDIGMQQQLEDIVGQGVRSTRAKSGSAIILDVNNGSIKAMVNYPSFSPAEFYKVTDQRLFNNPAVSSSLEVGSIMKPLTAAAAIDQGVVTPDTTYYDPAHFEIDGFNITNIEEDGGPGTRSVRDILQLSLNTGATWLLMQMGGGQINEKARLAWYDYMTNHYQFGRVTGIEQGNEATGYIPDPKKGYGLDLQYANTAFGQGMTATILQMAAALSAVVNGGTYYQPHLVDKTIDSQGVTRPKKPQIVRSNVVSTKTSRQLQSLMQHVFVTNHVLYSMPVLPPAYNIGGKTGTAQIPSPAGGYYDDRFNGTYMGFVGGDRPQYVILVRMIEPHVQGYAGTTAAAPIFVKTVNMLINNFNVTPKSR